MPTQLKIKSFFTPKVKKRKLEDEPGTEAKKAKTELTPEQKDRALTKHREAIQKLKANGNVKFTNLETALEPSWKQRLKGEFEKDYFKTLKKKLAEEVNKGVTIYPPPHQVYRAFELCPWSNLKVVLLGQDPYHGPGQAEGLCFSVQKGLKKLPPSLKNMYKEAVTDVGLQMPNHGSLVQWGKQGVLMLNTVLTVKKKTANSHKKFGWQKFTDAVIKLISREQEGVVFILWGGQAKKKAKFIDKTRHRIVQMTHPSPLGANKGGWWGTKPYGKTNDFLKELGKEPIDWTIDSDP